MCAPRALVLRVCHALILVSHACLLCVPGSIAGDRAPLSCAVGSVLFSLSCALCAGRARCVQVARAVCRSWTLCASSAHCEPVARAVHWSHELSLAVAFARLALSWAIELSAMSSFVATENPLS